VFPESYATVVEQRMNAEPRAWLLEEDRDEIFFAHGACHIFAAKLHALFGYSLKACRKNDGIVHCYAIRHGKGIDAKGSIDRLDFREEFTFERVEDITSSALLDYFRKRFPREESEEVSDGKSLNQFASDRAKHFIDANRDRFAPSVAL